MPQWLAARVMQPTLVIAAIVLGEVVTLVSLIGGGVILLGVWMVQRS